ncbi:uncharacterized protein TNCV_933181 [Trichonephila clavipes]|nr:uncharacterized protein TNCV_933181 [Trichonephila clavipes]
MVVLLAKRGTDVLQRSTRNLPLHSSKLEINRIFEKFFRDATTSAAKYKSWRVLMKPNCASDTPRAAAAAAEFRLLPRHDCICVYVFVLMFNLTDSPFCELCASGNVMDASHLDVRSVLKSLDCMWKKYWRTRYLMT